MSTKGSIKTLREMNTGLVLGLVRSQGPISRADVAKITGLTRSTVSDIVAALVAEDAVLEVGMGDNWTGRKPVLYEYNANLGFVLGLKIGGTHLSCMAADMAGSILARRRLPLPAMTGRSAVLAYLFEQVGRFCAEEHLDLTRLKAVGIASSGVVDYNTGRVLGASPNLPEWEDFALGDIVRDRFGVPVVVDNDVHCALIGEVNRGAAIGCRNAAFVYVSTGFGGALMLDGKLYRGNRFFAGEIGYWMAGKQHLQRRWGSRGCLETLASGPGIVERAEAGLSAYPDSILAEHHGRLTAEMVFAGARAGDALARVVVDETADYLGFATVNLAVLLDLDMVVLGGGVMRSADLLLGPIQSYVERHVLVPPKVAVSRNPEEASVLGAIEIVLDRVRQWVDHGAVPRP